MAVMGGRWAPAANVLSLLCVVGIVLAFTRFTEALLPALSRSHHLAILKWAECGVAVGALLLVATFLKGSPVTTQVMGIALARFAVGVILFGPILLLLLVRLSSITISDFASVIAPALLAASAMTAAILGISRTEVLAGLRPVSALSIEVILGATVTIGTLWIFDRQLKIGIGGIVQWFSRIVGSRPAMLDTYANTAFEPKAWRAKSSENIE